MLSISQLSPTLKWRCCTQTPLRPVPGSVIPRHWLCVAGLEEQKQLTCQCLPFSVHCNLHMNQKEVNCENFNLIFLEEGIVICFSFTERGWWHSVPSERVYLFPTPLFIGESFFQDLWELSRLMSKIVFPHQIWTKQARKTMENRPSHPWYCWQFGLDNSLFEGCPVHCRMCSIIPGLYTLDASSNPQVVTIKSVSSSSRMFPREKGAKILSVVNLWYRNMNCK